MTLGAPHSGHRAVQRFARFRFPGESHSSFHDRTSLLSNTRQQETQPA
jgi:hypothetical protein